MRMIRYTVSVLFVGLAMSCEPPPCTPGDEGCTVDVDVDDAGVIPTTECDDDRPCPAGTECSADGVCETVCPPGTLSCPCADGNACTEAGLACGVDGTCQQPTCEQGTVGCGCFADLTCSPQADGLPARCDPDFRVCRAVVDDSDQPGVPLSTCFTPCTESVALADGVRQCRADGLMEGCIGDLVCVQGSCVLTGENPPSCTRPTDCPGFQTCIDQGCYSNCTTEQDCAPGSVCDQHVCRQPCTATNNTCGRGFACDLLDGEFGSCKPLSPPDETPSDPVEPEMILSVDDDNGDAQPPSLSGHESMQFTPNFPTRTFRVTNEANVPLVFTIRKTTETRLTDAGRETTTYIPPADGVIPTNPLSWLRIGTVLPNGDLNVAQQQEFTERILAGDTAIFAVTEPVNSVLLTWEGALTIEAPGIKKREVWLEYSSDPTGQWSGSIHYFTKFDDEKIDAWRGNKSSENALLTKNALLFQWARFRESQGNFSLQQFRTLLKATRLESWKQGQTQEACDDTFPNVVTDQHCYLYADGTPGESGVAVYTGDAAEQRIPTGSIEMPFVMNLESDRNDPARMTGRIESTRALQFPGNPAVSLHFGGAPDDCEDPTAAACIVPIDAFSSTVLLGGRHLLEPGDECATASLVKAQTPWLVPEFLEGTVFDEDDGRTYREECKETKFPIASTSSSFAVALNQSFTDSNPIPDGRVRRRELKLLDGIMVNQDTMLLLVQESFDANLGSGASAANFSTYGVIELRKNNVEPTAEQLVPGQLPSTPSAPSADLLATTCSEDVLTPILGAGVAIQATNAGKVARTLVDGDPSKGSGLIPLSPTVVNTTIHWFCHSTGRFDGGPATFPGVEPCPDDSLVTFFSRPAAAPSVKNNACQGSSVDYCADGDCSTSGTPGTCAEVLAALSKAEEPIATRAILNPATVCEGAPGQPDFDEVACSDDRADLRKGRLFFGAGQGPKLPTLRAAVDDAFRYKSRFRGRSGKGIGFVPEICELDSDVVPYCYDPPAIEALRMRVDCLVSIYQNFPAQVGAPTDGVDVGTRTQLKDALGEAFSFYGETAAGVPLAVGTLPFDGFERLYAELLIMKGDDSLTRAASSRFDLAGANNALFEGNLLEPDGIQISGGAGFEMNLLYQAGQYYQLVLDRFARVSPALWRGLDDTDNNFVTIDTISTYFGRVIQASTKKARISSELATRYRAFNRPDLARRVIERGYAQAYLESAAIAQFMRRSVSVIDPNQIDALNFELERATNQTVIALDQMLEDYREITDNLTFFGDPPEFVSFPQAGNFDLSAVQTMIDRSLGTIQLAKEREERALTVSRTFDTDAAQFQSELSRVANGFENDLGDLCGLFEGNDGNVYPAIPKYASESPQTAIFGNACGLVGNGTIFDTAGDLEQAALDLRIAVQAVKDTLTEADIESQRARDECGVNFRLADLKFRQADRVTTIQSQITEENQKIAVWERELGVLDRQSKVAGGVAAVAQNAAGAASCGDQLLSTIGCIAGNVAAGAASTAVLILDGMALDEQNTVNADTADAQNTIQAKELEIANIQADSEFAQQAGQCCLSPVPTPERQVDLGSCVRPGPLMINSEARVKTILVGMKRASLAAERAQLEAQLTRGRLAQLRAKAKRLVAQQADSEQLLINVQEASNDPNVRILKNADVLDADKSFKNALVDAFRATRVFEYYTGQSYARQNVLFQARLVGRGENSIENYVNDLQRDLRAFEERFGRPSPRLMVVSVKNDVFRVPMLDARGEPLNTLARDKEFQRRLQDVSLLNARGYITVPFSTELDRTSPLTAIHKLTGIEIDLAGTGLGDNIGRMYLTARGTGTVRNLDRDLIFHRFPGITAVVNPTFGTTNRPNDPSLYRNTRLVDRPLINTNWELGLNQRDEFENQDMDLTGLQDIRIYFYYEDFTFVD